MPYVCTSHQRPCYSRRPPSSSHSTFSVQMELFATVAAVLLSARSGNSVKTYLEARPA